MGRRERLRRLDDEIAGFEKRAIGLAMVGRWTAAHDAELAALYEERRCMYEFGELSSRQLDGFACIVCGSEVEPQRPVGHGPGGQLFECVSHEKGTDDE